MTKPETLSEFCHDKSNVRLLEAAALFMQTYSEVTGGQLDIPDMPAEPVNINDLLGNNMEQSDGHDVVIFDMLHVNGRTMLYLNHVPGNEAVIIYSAPKNKFSKPSIYEEYTPGDEKIFTAAVKMAFSGG